MFPVTSAMEKNKIKNGGKEGWHWVILSEEKSLGPRAW